MGNGGEAPWDFQIDFYKGTGGIANRIEVRTNAGPVEHKTPWGLEEKEWWTDNIIILFDKGDPCVIHGGRRYCW